MIEYRNCKFCGKQFKIKIATKGPRKGKPIKIHENKKFCRIKCLNDWQKDISWEDRIGKERANEIREERSQQVSGKNNPSCNPEVAKKISESLKSYLSENPRIGEKNGFYGKTHSDEYKVWASAVRRGKRSYSEEQYHSQNKNTPKKENHPNWRGGISYGEYNIDFDRSLKDRIKNRDEHKCQICESIDGLLHIHHIDYDKLNSDERNLITLCNSCHSKTNWKRESWIVFFKPIMEQKYN